MFYLVARKTRLRFSEIRVCSLSSSGLNLIWYVVYDTSFSRGFLRLSSPPQL